MSGSVDVLLRVGDIEPRIDSLRLVGTEEASVAVSFQVGGSTVSLSFAADRFLAFVEQLRRFAETMPGKPS